MKVKAKYSIICEKGSILTGEIFEIDAKDLPMYGDAVEAVGGAPAAKAEPVKEAKPAKAEEPEQTAKPAEKPKAPARRKKVAE